MITQPVIVIQLTCGSFHEDSETLAGADWDLSTTTAVAAGLEVTDDVLSLLLWRR